MFNDLRLRSPITRLGGLGLVLVLLIAAAVLTVPSKAAGGGPGLGGRVSSTAPGSFVPGELLVRFRRGVDPDARADVLEHHGASPRRTLPLAGLELVRLPPSTSVTAAAADFEQDPEVQYAEPNYYYQLDATPNDPRFGDLWGLDNTGQTVGSTPGTADADVDAPEAWDVTTGSAAVTVAVLDSGLAYDNPDVAPNVWANPGESGGGRESNGRDDDGNGLVDDVRGWDFVAGDNDPRDFNGHGTHVAGTIGARGGDGQGVAGVGWQTTLMPVRVCDGSGACPAAAILAGYVYAGAKGARVANASFGGPGFSQAMLDAITAASGTLFVASAGNEANNNDASPRYPCAYAPANVLCVAATTQTDALASFSNYGATTVDLGAPGTNVLSTQPAYGPTIFTTGFETDIATGWTTGGTNDTWARTDAAKNSGSFSLTDSPAGNYVNGTNSFARTTSPISLAGQTGCKLDYRLLLATERLVDVLFVEGSSDASTWTALNGLSGSTGGSFLGFRSDLSRFDGSATVYLRFRLTSDANVTGDGAYLDDLVVRCLTSTYGGSEFAFFQGTSMAAPHVTGVAALVWAATPSSSVAQVRARLLAGVDAKASLDGRTVSGGRLNAAKALTLDTTPPDTTITAGPTGPTNDNTPTFSFSSNETGSTFQCRVDAAAFAACGSPHTTAALADGARTFEVRATDSTGNADPTPAARSFTVDADPPETTITAGPAGPTESPTPTFTFTADEAASTFECRVDSSPFAACGSPHTTASLATGPHTFEVRATDALGNTDQTAATRSFSVVQTVGRPAAETPLMPIVPATPPASLPPPDSSVELRLTAKAVQRVLAQGGVVVRFGCATERCAAQVAGTMSAPGAARLFRFRSVSRSVAANRSATVTLKASRKAMRAITRVLAGGGKVSAKVTVTVRDAAGNRRTQERTIRLR